MKQRAADARGGPCGLARSERGSAVSIEATIIIPVLVLFTGLVIVLAGDALAQQAVGASASQAARAASLERTSASARAAAESVANAALADSGISCGNLDVSVDATALGAALGDPASVSVTVTCLTDYDVNLPGFPQSRRISETRTSPVDTYRGR